MQINQWSYARLYKNCISQCSGSDGLINFSCLGFPWNTKANLGLWICTNIGTARKCETSLFFRDGKIEPENLSPIAPPVHNMGTFWQFLTHRAWCQLMPSHKLTTIFLGTSQWPGRWIGVVQTEHKVSLVSWYWPPDGEAKVKLSTVWIFACFAPSTHMGNVQKSTVQIQRNKKEHIVKTFYAISCFACRYIFPTSRMQCSGPSPRTALLRLQEGDNAVGADSHLRSLSFLFLHCLAHHTTFQIKMFD